MSTSVTDRKRLPFRAALGYLLIAVFVALFGAVYEIFSHGVYSFFMLYAFAFPLVLGALPSLLLGLARRTVPAPARGLWRAAIAALTVGSLVSGALEIFGTQNPLTVIYWLLGAALLLSALCIVLFAARTHRRADPV